MILLDKRKKQTGWKLETKWTFCIATSSCIMRLEGRQFWDEKLMAFGHDWIHSIQGYCPLDIQTIAMLTQKTSSLIDFLVQYIPLAIDKVLPLASARFRSRLQPSNSCQEKCFGRLWQPATEKNMQISSDNPMEKLGLLQWTKLKSPLAACTIRYTLRNYSSEKSQQYNKMKQVYNILKEFEQHAAKQHCMA